MKDLSRAATSMAPPRTTVYLRVSASDQDAEKNTTDLLLQAHDHALGPVHFVADTVWGRVPWRRRKITQVLQRPAGRGHPCGE